MTALPAIIRMLLGDDPSYPVVQSIAQTAWTSSAATSHPVVMPTGCVAGDLKLVLFDSDGDTAVTTPTGWSVLFSTAQSTVNRLGVYARIHVDGDPSTVDFATASGEQAAAQALRITSWRGTIAGGVEAATPQTGTSSTPNPAAFTPTFGAGNNLWLSVLGDSSVTPITAAPPGYANLTESVSERTSTGAQVYSASRSSATVPEDAGAWTSAGVGARVWSTIAIAPALQ